MDRWREAQLTLGVAIGAIRVINEPGGVTSIRGVDTDVVIEGVCVLSPYIVPEEPSRVYQEFGFAGVGTHFSLPIEVH